MSGGSSSRLVGLALVGIALGAGVFYMARSFEKPAGGKADNVAEAPAGGRTQAQEPGAAAGGDTSAMPPAIAPLGDPLQPGIPEQPDIPPDSPHAGLKKVGDRIAEAVLKDGKVGDHEVPGIDLTPLSQKQRGWFLAHAVKITCSCGCRQDLLECRRDDATCPVSPGLADSLVAVARKQ